MAVTAIAHAVSPRRLALRARKDLVIRSMRMRGTRVWAVKDPLACRYYHLNEHEWWILNRLDGQSSFEEILEQFNRQFMPACLQPGQLHAFLAQLHREGLIDSEAPGQSGVLLARAREQAARNRWRMLTNPLAIRFRGINPDQAVGWLAARLGWFFSLPAVAAAWLVMGLAALWLVAHQEEFRQRLPELQAWLTPAGVAWFLLAISLTKIMHELGHALVCKRLGGECRELGLMLLCFSPCLYCNVSDAWLIPSKWRRAAVGAAGIHVEMVLAAVACWLWWFSQPGLFNALCWNVMVIGSVNTLLINGNPLLRYDGYYVLSDLVEVPNLAQRANACLRGLLVRGQPRGAAPGGAEPAAPAWALATYAAASWVYRWVVLLALYVALRRTAGGPRLAWLVDLVFLLVAAGWLAAGAWRAARVARDPAWWLRLRPVRCLSALSLAAAALLLPLPCAVRVPAVIQARDAQAVYVTIAGRLREAPAAGELVAAGQTIAVLSNDDLEFELAQLELDLARQQKRLENLRLRQGSDAVAAARIPEAEQTIADLRQRLNRRRADQARLRLTAPRAGVILPPRSRPAASAESELPRYGGTPLEPFNAGCFLEAGAPLCEVAEPGALEALAIIEQHDVALVRPGQMVRLWISQISGEPARGRVWEISERNVAALPEELSGPAQVPVVRDEHGIERPAEVSYVARVRIDELALPPLPGAACTARIQVAPQSLGRRIWRFVLRTARLEGQALF